MTKDEALKLALEALDIVKIHFTQNRHVNEAITAIKQARSAPDCKETGVCIQTGLACFGQSAQPAPVQSCYCPNCEAMGKELAALKAQPAPVQEPVADVYMAGNMQTNIGTNGRVVYVSTVYSKKPLVKGDKLYTTPPAQPAPAPGYCKHCKQYSIEEPLPAAQRQWVGLTNEDIYDCDEANACRSALAYAIEAKIKEKNNG